MSRSAGYANFEATQAAIRSLNQRRLVHITAQLSELSAQSARLAAQWETRAPKASVAFQTFTVGAIAETGFGNLAAEVAAANALLDGTRQSLSRIVGDCVAEEEWLRHREVFSQEVVDQAVLVAGDHDSVRRVTRTVAPLGEEAPRGLQGRVRQLPAADQRVAKVAEILRRSHGDIDIGEAQRCFERALVAADETCYEVVLHESRLLVDRADSEASERSNAIALAERLETTLGDLDDPDVRTVRGELAKVIAGSAPMTPRLEARVDSVRSAATNRLIRRVLEEQGYEVVDEEPSRTVLRAPVSPDRQFHAVLNDDRLFLTPVVATEAQASEGESGDLVEAHCATVEKIVERCAAEGIDLGLEFLREAGSGPVRVDETLARSAEATETAESIASTTSSPARTFRRRRQQSTNTNTRSVQ